MEIVEKVDYKGATAPKHSRELEGRTVEDIEIHFQLELIELSSFQYFNKPIYWGCRRKKRKKK